MPRCNQYNQYNHVGFNEYGTAREQRKNVKTQKKLVAKKKE